MKSILVLLALTFSSMGFAKDLTNRLGVGYRDTLTTGRPALAVQYYPTREYGVIGAIGVDTQDQNSSSSFEGGVRRMIFREDNMNFFMGGTMAMISATTSGVSQSGYELGAHVGGEFFLTGLDSLGFNFQVGVSVASTNKVRFRTTADSPITAGIIFYF